MMASSEARRICLRMAVVCLNIPVLIIGTAALVVGLWVLLDDSSLFDLVHDVLDLNILGRDLLRQSSLIMITAGAALVVLAGIGVVGSLALSSCLLAFYAVVMILLLVLEVTVVILLLVFRSEWQNKANQVVSNSLKDLYGVEDDDFGQVFTQSFDLLQDKLSCCGWMGPSDYQQGELLSHWNTTLDNEAIRTVPDVCCNVEHSHGNESYSSGPLFDCITSPHNSSDIHSQGCHKAVKQELEIYMWTILAIAAALLLLQFVTITLTLASIIHNGKVKYEMREVRA